MSTWYNSRTRKDSPLPTHRTLPTRTFKVKWKRLSRVKTYSDLRPRLWFELRRGSSYRESAVRCGVGWWICGRWFVKPKPTLDDALQKALRVLLTWAPQIKAYSDPINSWIHFLKSHTKGEDSSTGAFSRLSTEYNFPIVGTNCLCGWHNTRQFSSFVSCSS